MATDQKKVIILLIGDVVILGLVTYFGFVRHGTLGTAGGRIVITFVPLVLGWLLAAPFLGAYDVRRVADWRQLWRPVWAMLLGVPLATWLRGGLLGNVPVQPVFVGVMIVISGSAILVWRSFFTFMLLRKL